MPEILQTLLKKTPATPEIELAFIRLGTSVLACDLDRNRRVRNLSALESQRLMILTSDRPGEEAQRVFLPVVRQVFNKNTPLMRLEPFILRRVLQDTLNELRQAHPDLGESIAGCRGFFLNHRKLYSLNETPFEVIYVYRRGSLLEFHIGPQHFIPLQPHDVLLLAKGDLIDLFKTTGQLKRFGSPGPVGTTLKSIREELAPQLRQCPHPASLIALRVDAHQPVLTENTRDQRVRILGRVFLFLLYASITTLILFGIFWLI